MLCFGHVPLPLAPSSEKALVVAAAVPPFLLEYVSGFATCLPWAWSATGEERAAPAGRLTTGGRRGRGGSICAEGVEGGDVCWQLRRMRSFIRR